MAEWSVAKGAGLTRPGLAPGGGAGTVISGANGVADDAPAPSAGARRAAEAFEAAFLAEMLRHTGLGETPDAFGGGIGEDQFAGLLAQAQAQQMVRAGGLGLTEYILRALQERSGE